MLERLLLNFHEFNWPRQIEDPLSGRAASEAKRRLHDTINNLNGCPSPQLIHFYGNGKDDGLCWTYTAEFLALYV